MGTKVGDALRSIFKRKKPTVTVTTTSPTTSSIKSIDYGTSTKDRVGGTTVVSTTTPSRTSSSGGGGGGSRTTTTTITSVGTTPSQQSQSVQQAVTKTQMQSKAIQQPQTTSKVVLAQASQQAQRSGTFAGRIIDKKVSQAKTLARKQIDVTKKVVNFAVTSSSGEREKQTGLTKTLKFGEQKVFEPSIKFLKKGTGGDIVVTRSVLGVPQLGIQGSADLFGKKVVTKTGVDIGDVANVGSFFVPVLGQVRATSVVASTSGKLIAKESITPLEVGTSALIGAGGVAKGVRFFGPEARTSRAVAKLEKVPAEVSIGVSRTSGDVDQILVGSLRKSGGVESKTLTAFEVQKLGDKSFQIGKGNVAQRISREGTFFRDRVPLQTTKGTFSGEASVVKANLFRSNGQLQTIQGIKSPTSSVSSKIDILTRAENPELLKSIGIGVQRTKGDVTSFVSFKPTKGLKLKTGEVSVIDLPTGRTNVVDILSGTKTRVGSKQLQGIGVIKKIQSSPSTTSQVGSTGFKTVQQTNRLENIATPINVQIESRLLQSQRVSTSIKPSTQNIVGATTPKQTSETKTQMLTSPKVEVVPVVTTIPKTTSTTKVITRTSSRLRSGSRSRSTTKSIQQQGKLTSSDTINQSITSTITRQDSSQRLRIVPRLETIKKIQSAPTPTPVPTFSFKNIRSTFRIPTPKKRKTSMSDFLFGVQVRRQGKFRTVGSNLSLREARALGQQRVSTTLGATFRITGKGNINVGTPSGFRTKKTKEGRLFIEKRKFRLSKKGEKVEIQEAKRRKRK